MFIILITIASLFVKINAHGYISYPEAKYIDEQTKTAYVDLINGPSLYPNQKWDDTPDNNLIQFNNLQINNLKKFITKHTSKICSKNDISQPIVFSPQQHMNWQNDQEKKGFITSHTGPCEVWFESKKVYHSNNCVGDNSGYPASIPINYKKCKYNCTMEFYWLALHEPNWQVYSGCAWIQPTDSNC